MIHIVGNQTYLNLDPPANFWRGFPSVKGLDVFLKPNLVSPRTKWDRNSTTDVHVMEMIIRKLIEDGAQRIVIGECGFKDQWDSTIKSTGYDRLLTYPGVEMIALQDGPNFHKFTLKRADKYRSLFGAKFSDYLLDCPVIINIPKMKMHCMAGVTGAIKNMMGVMAQKGSMHPRGSAHVLQERLADLYSLTSSMVSWTIMDGVIGQEYAEQSGCGVKSGVLISGNDQWEIDVAATKLMGWDPSQIPYLRYIRNDFDSVPVPLELIKKYEKPINWR